MDISTLTYDLSNIVLVFRDLQHARISRDRLRDALGNTIPEQVEVPPLIVLRYPQLRASLVVLVPENRIEAKVEKPDDGASNILARLATVSREAVEGVGLLAFGFNFHATVNTPARSDSDQYLLGQFSASLEPIARQLEGEPISVTSQFRYRRRGRIQQIFLAPHPEERDRLLINMNVHFDDANLPDETHLAALHVESRESFVEGIGRLFENL